jgi:hypothetical protein
VYNIVTCQHVARQRDARRRVAMTSYGTRRTGISRDFYVSARDLTYPPTAIVAYKRRGKQSPTQQYGKMCFLCGPCRGVILKTTGATQAVSS